jgi:predicted glycosyltransferase
MFATKILIPENLQVDKVVKAGGSKHKIISYPGVKEGIYLWQQGEQIHQRRRESTDNNIQIFIRPEPQTAQYYKGGENFLDEILMQLQDKFTITILPRNADQAKHYQQPNFSNIHVAEKPMTFFDIAVRCTLFIGAGGSMTRELAILGIPTISVYQDALLDVDEYLLKQGLMTHEPKLTAAGIVKKIEHLKDGKPATELMEKGKKAFELFIEEIEKFKKHD